MLEGRGGEIPVLRSAVHLVCGGASQNVQGSLNNSTVDSGRRMSISSEVSIKAKSIMFRSEWCGVGGAGGVGGGAPKDRG